MKVTNKYYRYKISIKEQEDKIVTLTESPSDFTWGHVGKWLETVDEGLIIRADHIIMLELLEVFEGE